MKTRYNYLIVLLFAWMSFAPLASKGQFLLGLADQEIVGFPDTVRFGDTIQGLTARVKNKGILPLVGTLVNVNVLFQGGLVQGVLGTLTSPLLFLPGDVMNIPLNPWVVNTQNSRSGANIMVIWPSAVVAPGEPTEQPYYVRDNGSRVSITEPYSASLDVYPNPVQDILYVSLPEELRGTETISSLFNLMGEEVLRKQGNIEQLHVADLPRGIYILKVSAPNGYAATQKVVLK